MGSCTKQCTAALSGCGRSWVGGWVGDSGNAATHPHSRVILISPLLRLQQPWGGTLQLSHHYQLLPLQTASFLHPLRPHPRVKPLHAMQQKSPYEHEPCTALMCMAAFTTAGNETLAVSGRYRDRQKKEDSCQMPLWPLLPFPGMQKQ